MCFITFLAIYQGKFCIGQFYKQKLGIESDPSPPGWDKIPSLAENFEWTASFGLATNLEDGEYVEDEHKADDENDH